MPFALSRTMRMSDYEELESQLELLSSVERKVGGQHPAQHHHRRWEYAMLLKAVQILYGGQDLLRGCHGIDFACGVGLGGSLLLNLGCDYVKLTEIWTSGDWSDWQLRQMGLAKKFFGGCWDLSRQDVVREPEEESRYQAALCISSIEHIPDFEAALKNMGRSVEKGGFIFLTCDYAQDGSVDNYAYKELRAQMMDKGKMRSMAETLAEVGFAYPDGPPDWTGDIEKLVNDYTFASLTMVKTA